MYVPLISGTMDNESASGSTTHSSITSHTALKPQNHRIADDDETKMNQCQHSHRLGMYYHF